MAEREMRQTLIKALAPLHAVSVENRVHAGTPDIALIGHWIECKWIRSWPKKLDTPVRLPCCLKPQQKIWLKEHRRKGGNAWVMLCCRKEWILLEAMEACNILELAPLQELIDKSYFYQSDGLDAYKLIKALDLWNLNNQ